MRPRSSKTRSASILRNFWEPLTPVAAGSQSGSTHTAHAHATPHTQARTGMPAVANIKRISEPQCAGQCKEKGLIIKDNGDVEVVGGNSNYFGSTAAGNYGANIVLDMKAALQLIENTASSWITSTCPDYRAASSTDRRQAGSGGDRTCGTGG